MRVLAGSSVQKQETNQMSFQDEDSTLGRVLLKTTYFFCIPISPSVNWGGKQNGLLLKVRENGPLISVFVNKMWREGEGLRRDLEGVGPGPRKAPQAGRGWTTRLPGRPLFLSTPKILPTEPGTQQGLWQFLPPPQAISYSLKTLI